MKPRFNFFKKSFEIGGIHSPFKMTLSPPEFRWYEHLSGILYSLSLKIINKVSTKELLTHHSLCAHFLAERASLNLVS